MPPKGTKQQESGVTEAAEAASLSSLDGKVSAAAAGADAESNATTMGALRSRLMGFNGTTWDRLRAGITTASATLTGFLNTLPWGIYHATPTARTDGQGGTFETNAYGDMGVAGTLADGQTNTRNPVLTGGEAQDPTSLPTATTAGKIVRFLTDLSRRMIVTLGTTIAGEDLTNDLMKVEQRYTTTRVTADGVVKSGAGYIKSISIAPTTATPTAGLLTIYDNTAESGTIVYSEWIFATTPGHTIDLHCSFGTGLYVGYDATLANVSVEAAWR